jgi:IS4 transposase
VKLTGERRSDGSVLKVGPWVRGTLMLFDLGYYGFSLFERIARNGGYFISRLKAGANPKIVAVNRTHRGRSLALVGEYLQDVLPELERGVLDVEVEVRFQHRRYGGRRRSVCKVFRLVGIKDSETGEYHLYITNLGCEELAAEHIQRTYALRWEVELLFKELKTHYHLEELPSSKPHVVKALVYAAALTLLVSRCLLHAVRRVLGRQRERLKSHRWAMLVATLAADILILLLRPPHETRLLERNLSRMLLHEAPDPNVNRLSLLQAVEAGVHRYRRAIVA